jgi:vesicle coat complex subunit
MSETTKQKVKLIMVEETPYVVSLQKPEVKDKVIITVAGQHPSIVVLENETIFNLVIENKLSSNQAFKIFMEPNSLKFTSEQIEKILENDGIMDVEFDEGVYKYSI